VRWFDSAVEKLKQAQRRLAPYRFYMELSHRSFDLRYGLQTRGRVERAQLDIPKPVQDRVTRYEASKTRVFSHILARLPVAPDEFTFIDLGAGKGRALILAAEHGFKRVIGVEISPKLHSIGQDNVARYTSRTGNRSHIQLLLLDVLEFAIPAERTVYYLYNPFDEATTAHVLDKIAGSVMEHPRDVWIVFVFPLCGDLLNSASFLERKGEGKIWRDHYQIYKVRTAGWAPYGEKEDH